jgi:hypothetical protein
MEPNLSLPSSRPVVEAETDRMSGNLGATTDGSQSIGAAEQRSDLAWMTASAVRGSIRCAMCTLAIAMTPVVIAVENQTELVPEQR